MLVFEKAPIWLLTMWDKSFFANGEVYLVSDGQYTKIGKAVNPEHRLKGLQTGNPRKLNIIGTIPNYYLQLGDSIVLTDIEHCLHDIYRDKQVQLEWYDLTENDINTILSMEVY